MKKVTLILAALALVLGISQCKKQEEPAQNGEKQHIVLTASNGNDGSKVDATVSGNLLGLTWDGTETITVTGGMDGTLHYKSGAATSTATFEGDVTKVSDNNIVFSLGQPDYMEQAGTLDGLNGLIHLQGTSPYREDGKYDVRMKLQNAVLKLDLSAFGSADGTMVTINAGEEPVASVTGITADLSAVYVAMPAAESTTYTFTGNGLTATKSNWTLVANHFYTANDEGAAITIEASPIPTPELLTGKFSVSATEYVQFSRGNLFCTDNGSGAYSFAFELNQYDFRNRPGKASLLNGVYSTTSGTPDNTSGAFQWNVSAAVSGQDYGAFGTGDPGTPAEDATLDWGLAIGDNWYTMTKEEMVYLTGFGAPGRPNYENLSKNSKIVFSGFEMNGFVLAPDNYDFTSNPLKGSYTESEWTQAEKEYGLVFFPCAGFNNDAWAAGVTGRYYLSKKPGDHLYFGENGEHYIGNSEYEYYYCASVRLVKKFEKPHDAVKIGGVYWATTNIGATTPKEYGWYFSWGNTTGYIHNGSAWVSVKDGTAWPNYDGTEGHNLSGNIPVSADYDAAQANWGESWRMPTQEDFAALRNACTGNTGSGTSNISTLSSSNPVGGVYWLSDTQSYLSEYSGVAGVLFVDRTDTSKRVFFPAAGFRKNAGLQQAGSTGICWSSSNNTPSESYSLLFINYVNPKASYPRSDGFTIRPVHD